MATYSVGVCEVTFIGFVRRINFSVISYIDDKLNYIRGCGYVSDTFVE